MKSFYFFLGVAFLTVEAKLKLLASFLNEISAPNQIIVFHCNEPFFLGTYERLILGRHFQVGYVDMAKEIPDGILHFYRTVFIADLQCYNRKKMLEKAKQGNLFHTSNVWIFLGEIGQIGDHHFFSRYGKTFVFTSNGLNVDIYKIFKNTDFARTFNVVLVYTWSLLDSSIIYKRLRSDGDFPNLMKEPVRASYALIYDESSQHLTDYRYIQQDIISKISFLLIQQICDLFNATHVPILRRNWGNYDNLTGTFTPLGMFSDVQNGVADIAGNFAATTYIRLRHFRFLATTGCISLNYLKWFFKAPPLSYTENIWLLPFVKNLWLALFAALVIWYLALTVVAACELNLFQGNKINERNCWFIALDVIIATFTQRGSNITFSTGSGRLISYCLFILFVLLNIAYSAHFLVLLQSAGDSIQNFDDLLRTGMTLGSLNEPYNYFYLMNPNDLVKESVRRKIHSVILERGDRFWLNVSEGIQMVKNGAFAYHVPSSVGYDEISKTYDEATKRSIRIINSVLRFNNYLCVKKNSSMEDFLSYGFLYLHEKGITRREQNKIFPQKISPDLTKAIFSSVTLNDVRFLFFILCIGASLSFLILLAEIVHCTKLAPNRHTNKGKAERKPDRNPVGAHDQKNLICRYCTGTLQKKGVPK